MLDAIAPFRRPSGSLIDLPGPRPSASGPRSDGMEGFARTFWLAACAAAGTSDRDERDRILAPYAEGLDAGTNRTHPDRWPRADETAQIMVESGSIAFALHATRDELWARLDDSVRQRVAEYLLGAVVFPVAGNWHFFRVMVHSFLRTVGYDVPTQATFDSLDAVNSYYRGDGWYSDGDGLKARTFDYYNAWAFHLYPALWSVMEGNRIAPELVTTFAQRSALHVDTLTHMIGGDGAPIYQGRSLIYRAAMSAAFGAAAIIGADVDPGLMRNASIATMSHFIRSGAIGEAPLTMGWHAPAPTIAQDYSGPASPYWLSNAFVNLLLPDDHPYWTAPLTPLPIEHGDFTRREAVPGWLLHGTTRDGIVRLLNHGTFRPREGRDPHSRHLRDDPNYSRLAYSTKTAPVLDSPETTQALPHFPDNSVCLRTTTGEALLRENVAAGLCQDSIVRSTFHLADPGGTIGFDVDLAAEAKGAIEIRSFRIHGLAGQDIFVSGYALPCSEYTAEYALGGVRVEDSEGLSSWLRLESGQDHNVSVEVATHPNAFGPASATPLLTVHGVAAGEWVVVSCSVTRRALGADRITADSLRGSSPAARSLQR